MTTLNPQIDTPHAMPLPRVFISTDLRLSANEKDDAQSLIHALLYQDEMNIVGIAGTASKWSAQDGLVGDIDTVIDVYGQDLANIRAANPTNPNAFKSVDELKAVTWQGATDTAPSQGWSNPTDSSRAIIDEAHKAAAAGEVLNVLTWGGETDLAQALHDDPSIAPHIRFFSIDDQDLAAYAYIHANFKGELDMWVDNTSTFRGTYASPAGGDWKEDIIKGWHEENAAGHGALGDLFAEVSSDIFGVSGVKMGDSPTVFRFISGDQDDPTKESWGGEFVQQPSGGPGRYYTDNPDDALDFNRSDTDGAMTVYEDRSAWLEDFATRLDWLEGGTPTPTPPPPATGNLLKDASFEGPSVATGQWVEFGSTPGWTAIAGGRIEVWDAHGGVTATNGAQFAELDFRSARDGFYQDVEAATGQAHTLSFDLRARPGAPVSSQGVEVVWNGQVVATATPGTDWGTFTTTVTGAAGTDRLIIREVASQGGDGLGALVDDFVLVQSGSPAEPDTVSVRVSGDAWEGDPAFALLVNGVTVAPSTVVTADHAAGEWQTLTFTGDWDLDGSDQVGVRFLEDRYAGPGRDRNLYVDEVSLNGEANGTDRTFLQSGITIWDL
jgi:hypothetical protein